MRRAHRFLVDLTRLGSSTSAIRPGLTVPGAHQPYAGSPLFGTQRNVAPSSSLRRTLAACTGEGVMAEVVGACSGSAVLSAWALHVGATPLEFGLLGAMPFVGQALQPVAAWLTDHVGPRRTAMWAVAASRQLVLALAILPWLAPEPHVAKLAVFVVTGLQASLGVIGNNAWVAWMSELVPESLRGRYFGRRTALCTAGGTLAGLLVGAGLDASTAGSGRGIALSLLALVAALTGAVTTVLMARQQDVPSHPHDGLGAQRWLAPLRDARARALLIYKIVWNAAVGVGGGFFALHVLENLEAGFLLLSLHGAGVAIFRIAMAPVWGRVLDRVGATRVLATCSLGIAGMPLVWLLPRPEMLWPLALDAVLAGVFWSGHSLAALALPMSFGSRRDRPYYLAAFSMAGGLAYAGATAAGGLIATVLPARFELGGQPVFGLYVLFVLSALGRALAASLALGAPLRRAAPALASSR